MPRNEERCCLHGYMITEAVAGPFGSFKMFNNRSLCGEADLVECPR